MDIAVSPPRPDCATGRVRPSWPGIALGVLLLVLLWLAAPAAWAQQTDTRNYDHNSTGFPLTGSHRVARCESCHTGGVLRGTPRNCEGCHVAGARLAGNNVVKPQRHLPTSQGCETCHNTRMFTGARFDHFGVRPGSCESCHNGAVATGKPGNHIATASACDSCHRAKRSWTAGTTFAHTPANAVGTGTCDSCHNGTVARGRPAVHVPVTAATARCDSCHRSQASFATAVTMNHAVVNTARCLTCHNGSLATGKDADHIQTTESCEACHRSTSSWTAGVTYVHSPANAVGTGTCDSCHNGRAAQGRPASHIPVTGSTARCDSCHRSQASFNVAVTMNHTVVATAGCKSCHNGAFVSQGPIGALAKPGNHIPEQFLLGGGAMECNACHTSTTTWTAMRMNHNNSTGNGAGTCRSCHQSGTNFLGNMQRESVTHESRTAVDCSQAGCHRPIGRIGNTYIRWE